MKTRIMLDLETLGNKPGSVIVAIGAVKFGGGEIHSEFYQRVDVASCVAAGLNMDVPTVLWWLEQGDEARKEITKPGAHISQVLLDFSLWADDLDCEVWGNGANFDNVLLSDAYAAVHQSRPWKFWNDRCYRTVKSLHPHVVMTRGGTHHNALDDAKSQAMHLMDMLGKDF